MSRIDAVKQTIYNYLKEKTFVIPEYQRAYTWDIKENNKCDVFWDDIENYFDTKPDYPYLLGTIILDCSEGESEISIVDGQQRTITFLLLLKAMQLRIKDALENLKDSEESRPLIESLTDERNNILNILYKAGSEERYYLLKDWNSWIKNHNCEILKNKSINELDENKKDFQKILEAETFDDAKNSVCTIKRRKGDNKFSNFFNNFNFFYEKLNEKYNESANLNAFVKFFLGAEGEKICQIIEIKTYDKDQAIEVFNSLNSKGEPLSTADLVSARLYSNSDGGEKFDKLWKEIKSKTKELESLKIDIDSILQQNMYITRAKDEKTDVKTPGLRDFYLNEKKDEKQNKKCDLLKNPEELCVNLKKIAEIWNKMQSDENSSMTNLLLKFNSNLKLFLISYLNRFMPEELSAEKIKGISECFLRLFAVLELEDKPYSSQEFKGWLFKENKNLVKPEYEIEKIKADFSEHIAERWGKKKEDIRKKIQEDYEGNVLVYLNEYLYVKEKYPEEKFYLGSDVNIEHLMAASGTQIETIRKEAGFNSDEKEFESYKNKIGNKICLEESINKSIKNESFGVKKESAEKKDYRDSQYKLAKDLCDYAGDYWKKEDIENATKKAADRILKFIFGEDNS